MNIVSLHFQMPGMTGLQAAEALRGMPDAPLVLFVTAYDEHALAAFDREAVDYVLKPPNPARLRRALDRVKTLLSNAEARSEVGAAQARTLAAAGGATPATRRILGWRAGSKAQVPLDPAEIDCFTARGDACYAVRGGEELAVRATLASLEEELAGVGFFRVHRGWLVNLARVAELAPWFSGTWWLKLKGAKEASVPVSREAMRELKKKMGGGA